MRYTIKSLSEDKKHRWEIHKAGCKDINRNDPIQVFEIEGDTPEEIVEKDNSDNEFDSKEFYKIMNCCK